jgi:serpin B
MRAPLYIRAAIQKACIALDEDGTTASAATGVMVESAAVAEDTPPRQFVADRPFLFVVRDSCSGSILFLGRVTCP